MRYKIKYEYVEYYEEYEFLEADSIEEAKLKFEKMKIWEDYEPRADNIVKTYENKKLLEVSESE